MDLVGERKPDILLISDENILGTAISYPNGVEMYPNCERRLRSFARIIGTAPERVHVTIRDYSTFLVSAYAMSAIYGKDTPSFSKIEQPLLAQNWRWSKILSDLQTTFPKSQITFSTYEKHPVLAALVALLEPEIHATDLSTPARTINSSPTVEAIQQALISSPGSDIEADRLLQEHSDGTTFDPLSPTQKSELSALYKLELQEIRNNFHEATV